MKNPNISDIREAERSLRELKIRFLVKRGWRPVPGILGNQMYELKTNTGKFLVAEMDAALVHLGYTDSPDAMSRSVKVGDVVRWNDWYYTIVSEGNMKGTFDLKPLSGAFFESDEMVYNIPPESFNRVIEI